MKALRSIALVLALAAMACGPGSHSPTTHLPGEGRTVATVQVSDDGFAGAVRDLLSSPWHSTEHDTRLQGVLARQLERADVLFHHKSTERGIASVKGALY